MLLVCFKLQNLVCIFPHRFVLFPAHAPCTSAHQVAGWWRALRTCGRLRLLPGMAPRRRPRRGGVPRNSGE